MTARPKQVVTRAVIDELVRNQRERAAVIKSRIMQTNRLQALVAGTLGYFAGLTEAERRAKFVEAGKVVARVADGEDVDNPFVRVIRASLQGLEALDSLESDLSRRMTRLAAVLPVAAWVESPERKGFGLKSLAVVVGECGDLADYANPAKVWRRLGCAPWSFGGKTMMGSTWKSGREGRLPAAEWQAFGYSPRRRSIAYVIGENLVKQNFLDQPGCDAKSDTDAPAAPGPYRRRYDEVKAHALANRPDWTRCGQCGGTGQTAKDNKTGKGRTAKCPNCKGTGQVRKRCHLHAMLLATKMLLRDLWNEWNGKEVPLEHRR